MKQVFTIGFTKKSARTFFSHLGGTGARRLVDIRLNNVSQLAGFAKRDDLAFFVEKLSGMEYVHEPRLAPTQDLFDDLKGNRLNWSDFERRFRDLLTERRVEIALDPGLLENSVLLCSEATAERCHRRLVVDYLRDHWGDFAVTHL